MGLLRWWRRQRTERIDSYLGPLDVPQKISVRSLGKFRHLCAFDVLDDVWVTSQDASVHGWVQGKIMGVVTGIDGRPFYFVGYYDPDHDNYTIVPYHGPIRSIEKDPSACKMWIVK